MWKPVFLPLHRAFACRNLLERVDPPRSSLPDLHGLLHRSGDLYTGELHVPTSLHSQTARRYCSQSACCKHMFQVFQMFQRYVASVLYWCCKNRSGCCICCNGYTRMLKCILNCFMYFRRMLQVFYQYVANVDLDVPYTCMLQACVFKCF
jgi:hypothetical protein